MIKLTKMKAVMAAFLILVLLVPQGVFAAPVAKVRAEKTPAVSTGDRLTRPQADFRPGEVIFKTDGKQAEADILKKYRLRVIRRDQRLGYVLAGTQAGTEIWPVVSRLQKEKHVYYAQPNFSYSLLGKVNDPQLARQWAAPKIKVEQGWGALGKTSPVIMAILDTGIDVNHPDLKNRLVPGMNAVNPLKSARDSEGHGTHVAGIAGAAVNNGVGVAGVAGIAGVKIMPVKVFDEGGGSDTTISDGLIWAVDHGARVINMSFGSFYQSEVLNEAINYAYDKGVILVAAAGNWASQEISYPAGLAKVIAVSATGKDGKLADFSSFGPQIDVSAPGDKIYSTYWDPYKGSTYSELSGTSMASPMVAGLAALLLAKNPKLTGEDVRQIIEVSSADLGDPGWDPRFGHGQIDVYKALTTSLAKYDDGNGVMDKAVVLKNGAAGREKINTGSDVDWYKINLAANAHLQVEVLPAGQVTPGVEIYDSAGAVLAAFNSSENDENDVIPLWYFEEPKNSLKVAQAVYGLVPDLEPGDYYIKVFGNHFRWSDEDYTITARVLTDSNLVTDSFEPNNSFEKAKNISIGAGVSGAILDETDEDWFRVDLMRGAYKIQVTSPRGLDLAVDVESEYNFRESSGDDLWSYYDRMFTETIDNTGQGQDEEGVITLPDNGRGRYYLRVYDTGGNAVNEKYTLTISGISLKADKFESNNTWEAGSTVEFGEEIKANFHKENDQDWYKLTVPGTGTLSLKLDLPSEVWADLEVYSDPGSGLGQFPDYPSWDEGFGNGGDGKKTYEVKVTQGEYYIKVFSYDQVSAEDYSLQISFAACNFVDIEVNDTPLKANPMNINEIKSGTLYPNADVDFYVFDIIKPEPYLVYVTPPGNLDTLVGVLREVEPDENTGEGEGSSQGDEGDSGDDSKLKEEPLVELVSEINNGSEGQPDTGVFVATKPGRYYIAVTAVPDEQNETLTKSLAPYSLIIKPFKIVPDSWENNNTFFLAKSISDGVPIRPTFMGTEDTDWFKIKVPGSGKLSVNLTVPEDIDGVIEIFDAAGRFMGKADESMVGEEEKASITVTKPGYYYIKVYDYLGNSSIQSYTITARYLKTVPLN